MERKETRMYSLTEAAKVVNVTPATLRRAARKRTLKAEKIGPRAWVVSEDDLRAWAGDERLHKSGPKSA